MDATDRRLALLLALAAGLLTACDSSSPSSDAASLPPATVSCAQPSPVQAVDGQTTVAVPQDFDPTDTPAPQTTVYFTLLLPQRCPGQRFPVILHSHGYGGSRITAPAADGTLFPEDANFAAMDELAAALPYHGYAVISFDERGHGESQPQNGGGYARLIDPAAETQDARAILDWAYQHAADYGLQTESGTGIDKDLRVGTLGYSYGGAFQLPLAALDRRIDAIVPDSTWHSLLYSLVPGNVVKQSWAQILCLFAVTPSSGATIGAINTPLMRTACDQLAMRDPAAFRLRTYDELVAQMSAPHAQPRSVSEDELLSFFGTHGMSWFATQQAQQQPWGFGETTATLRAVPALFIQGNRDNLFNLTQGWWNWRYFRAAGGDARLLSMEGGHMNPVAGQVEGSADCGGIQGIPAILAWFDHYLKYQDSASQDSASFDAIPRVCLSVAATVGAPDVTPMGLALDDMPVGSQTGAGGVPAQLASLSVTVPAGAAKPVFVPVVTIAGDGRYLAGVPSIASLTVTRGTPATHAAVAQIGIGIRRNGRLILVDDQIAPFVEGSYTDNPHIAEGDPVLLPAIGEPLQHGDEVGLLFYEQTIQYAAITSVEGLANLPGGVVSYALGKPLPHPLTSVLNPALGVLTDPNPYAVTASDVELPIVIPGEYPHSRLIPVGG